MTKNQGWLRSVVAYLNRSALARNMYTRVKRVPFVGSTIQKLARIAAPSGTRVWLQIPSGRGKGLWLHLDTRFELDYANGGYERVIENAIASNLSLGSVFYDVGAHIGLFSLIAARIVGEKGVVFAFEADSDNAERIRLHAERNGLNQIHVLPCAVWRAGGKLSFQRALKNSSRNQGAVVVDPEVQNGDTTEVDALSLDSFSTVHPAPTLVKVDIEGGEIAALQGSEQMFTAHEPVLICEVHNRLAEEFVRRWLSSKNYTITFLEESEVFPRHITAKRT